LFYPNLLRPQKGIAEAIHTAAATAPVSRKRLGGGYDRTCTAMWPVRVSTDHVFASRRRLTGQ
jgi:hypothetical protein